MGRIEKTVFISYRRTNFPWALAIFQDLTYHGYDVFFDYTGIASGDFERIILENIQSRAHFLVLLTPSALEQCGQLGDWLRREIECALGNQRNIVPLMLEGFDFATPAIASQLTGALAQLKRYNALGIPPAYFFEAMGRLRDRYLNAPLDAVLQPASPAARLAATEEKNAASMAPAVAEQELTAQQCFERGFNSKDPDEQVRLFSQAIALNPTYINAFIARGMVYHKMSNLDAAMGDYDEAIRLRPDHAKVFNSRGTTRYATGDLHAALLDFEQAIRLKPDYADAIRNRDVARRAIAAKSRA
jgi:tetratricopeptide (TPR) repeat protein